MEFKSLSLHSKLLEGLDAMGFEKATPIQEQSIPHILEGKDVIGAAQTGTGKTAAFLLPVMNAILKDENRTKTSALVVVPTRELAVQIDKAIEGFSYFTDISSIAIYGGGGGDSYEREKKALTTGTDVIIATPGRLLSHLNFGYVDFSELKFFILDEADRMLDMGFYADIMRIHKSTKEGRQGLLFSATMPSKILDMGKKLLKDPVFISLALSKPAKNVLQAAYMVHPNQKNPLVVSLLDKEELQSAIVFSSRKKTVGDLARELKRKGLSVGRISSDLEQTEREEVLLKFRNKRIKILVATDVVARGIDIKGIELVVNYDVPGDAEDYVHRIGRTARADASGVGITLITVEDQHKFADIEQLIEQTVQKLAVPDGLGPQPEYNPRAPRPKRPGGHGGGGKRRFDKGKRNGNGKSRNKPSQGKK